MTTAFHPQHTKPSAESLDELMHWIDQLRKEVDGLKGDLKEGLDGVHHRLDWQREWIKEQQRRLP